MNAIFTQDDVRSAVSTNPKGMFSADTVEAAEQLKLAAERFLISVRTPGGLEI